MKYKKPELSAFSLKIKIYLAGLSVVSLFIILFALIIIPGQHQRILTERKAKLKAAVDIISSLAWEYEREYRNNSSVDLRLLQEEFLGIVQKLRYEKNEYFFVLDGSGYIQMHPLHPGLYQWNMLGETDYEGRTIFRDVLRDSMRYGEVFIDALWQTKYNDQKYEEQIVYGKYLWQWDWVLCSTLFTQDIRDDYRRTTLFTLIYLLTTVLIVFFMLFVFISHHISKPLKYLLRGIYEIQNNNLEYRIPSFYKDELGYITDQFNRMVENRKQFEDQLIQSQKLEIIGTMASGISHDFNNVIGSISALVSYMKISLDENRYMPSEKQKKHLETIQQCCNRASSIVNQLLTFTGSSALEMKQVDLNEVLHNIGTLCEISLEKSVETHIYYSEKPRYVMADQVQLEQTLLNFCINAGHAMTFMRGDNEKQGGLLQISSEQCQRSAENITGLYWKISITDNGVGMDQKTMDRIFDPFFSTKKNDRGSGLGMAMAYHIIKDHQGLIEVLSSPGEGTTFIICIPVYADSDSDVSDNIENIRGC